MERLRLGLRGVKRRERRVITPSHDQLNALYRHLLNVPRPHYKSKLLVMYELIFFLFVRDNGAPNMEMGYLSEAKAAVAAVAEAVMVATTKRRCE